MCMCVLVSCLRCTRARVSSIPSSIVSLNERSPVWLHPWVHQARSQKSVYSCTKRTDIFELQIFTCSCDFLLAYRKLLRHINADQRICVYIGNTQHVCFCSEQKAFFYLQNFRSATAQFVQDTVGISFLKYFRATWDNTQPWIEPSPCCVSGLHFVHRISKE